MSLLAGRAMRHLVRAQAGGGGSSNSGNVSRRRSQRLTQRGRTKAPDLQGQLQEREARRAEWERRVEEIKQAEEDEVEVGRQQRQQQRQQAAPAAAARAQEQAVAEAPAAVSPSYQAMDELLQRLKKQAPPGAGGGDGGGGETPTPAGVEVPSAADLFSSSSAAAAVGVSPPAEVVEADAILEQTLDDLPGGALPRGGLPEPPPVSRQAAALLEIMQAGEEVEEVIAARRGDIDETMLQLLQARIKAARELERDPEMVGGLELLLRRLKSEVERQRAPPELRLLDELLTILDPTGDGEVTLAASVREERAQQAAARVRAAFAGGLPPGADVLSLAAQLGDGPGGAELADQLVADPVEPMRFMAAATELLQRSQEQQRQVAGWVQQQRAALEARMMATADGMLGDEDATAAAAAKQLAQAEAALEQRAAAAALVQRSLDIAQAVIRQLNLA